MRFLGKLSLFAVFLIFPVALSASESAWCPMVAWSQGLKEFGSDGQDGDRGRDGRDGRSGENQTIVADGNEVYLELSGSDGEDGEDGEDGIRAYHCRQPRRRDRNVSGADGGNGGDGGDGGDGGNGGSLTVYYTNIEDLKKISVRSQGGEGGRSGRGGRGSRGCRCQERDWDIKKCSGTPGTPEYSCKTGEYRCSHGSNGSGGSDGEDGTPGRRGRLSLINGTEPISRDEPTVTVAIRELQDSEFVLSKNIWQIHRGAASLLAPGSIIAAEYREFIEQITRSVRVVWQESRPPSDFNASETATIALLKNKRVKITFPEEIWVEATELQQEDGQENDATLVISHAIRQSEATKLAVAGVAEYGSNLNISLVDMARKSDAIATEFFIKYRSTSPGDRSRRRRNYRTRYEGTIPADFISYSYNRFTLNLGKLPIDSKYLIPGIGVDIELVAVRSLGDRSTEQKINWLGEIKRRRIEAP